MNDINNKPTNISNSNISTENVTNSISNNMDNEILGVKVPLSQVPIQGTTQNSTMQNRIPLEQASMNSNMSYNTPEHNPATFNEQPYNMYQQPIMNQQEQSETRSKWFWKDGLSIDETKMSTLILCLIVCMTFGGMNYIVSGDITNNLTLIIQTLIYAIAGVNIGNSIMSRFGSSNNSNMYNNGMGMNSNMYNNPMNNGSNMYNNGYRTTMGVGMQVGIREVPSNSSSNNPTNIERTPNVPKQSVSNEKQ